MTIPLSFPQTGDGGDAGLSRFFEELFNRASEQVFASTPDQCLQEIRRVSEEQPSICEDYNKELFTISLYAGCS